MGNTNKRKSNVDLKKDFAFKIQKDKQIKDIKISKDDFIRQKVIGKGTFGKVVLAKKKQSGKLYALKIIKKKFIIQEKVVDEILDERFLLAGISHPFITRLKYAFQTETRLFLALEYIPGGNLDHHLERFGRFEESQAAIYISELIIAIEFLHERGILHRDLKLSNVLLNVNGHIKLTDFGLSKFLLNKEKLTDPVGTTDYMAPEVVAPFAHNPPKFLSTEGKYDEKVDYWALGIMLYEMLVGDTPFDGETDREIVQNICHQELEFPEFVILSREAMSLIKKLLRKDPKKRLCTAENIKKHSFFKKMKINFRFILSKPLTPLFIPKINSPSDTRNYKSPSLDNVPVDSPIFSPDGSSGYTKYLLEHYEDKFQGFEYSQSYEPNPGDETPKFSPIKLDDDEKE